MTHEADKTLEALEDFTMDLQDAFSESLVKKDEHIRDYPGVSDGFFSSHLIRAGVKCALLSREYKMANIANTGLEVHYGQYCIKIVRSSHSGDVPSPTTVSRATWCMANQPRLFCDGITPEDMWAIGKLRLPGGESEDVVSRVLEQQNDGLVHLLVDWEEIPSKGIVRLAISMPLGVWAPGETPKVAWRYVIREDAIENERFVPSDETFNVFDDDDESDAGMGVAVE